MDEAVHRRKLDLAARIRTQRCASLVVNTRSRKGRHLFEEARRLLQARGFTLAATFPVRDPARLPEVVRARIAAGDTLVVVGGGDGTLSSVVDDFAHRDVVLGILPLGTANSFARTLGLPLDVEGAVDVIVEGKVVDVDLGMVDGNYFAEAAAVGLPASLARDMPGTVKRLFGRVGYLFIALYRLARHRAFRCTLTAFGHTHAFEALEVRLANGKHQGGVMVADEAHPESRDLVIQAITGRSRWALLRFWACAIVGIRPAVDDVAVFRARDVVVEASPPQYVSVDGEPVAKTPIRARVAEQALHVLVRGTRADLT